MDKGKKVAGLLLLLVAIAEIANGDESVCGVGVSGLMTCKPAVTEPNPAPPTEECCAAISKADLKCLCQFKTSPLLPSLGIDPQLALDLPVKCGLPHPPC
ncbi:hypothetical protein Ancab_019965 [Ancistrocladus abbreviatus]